MSALLQRLKSKIFSFFIAINGANIQSSLFLCFCRVGSFALPLAKPQNIE
jgi:hypothetical protein